MGISRKQKRLSKKKQQASPYRVSQTVVSGEVTDADKYFQQGAENHQRQNLNDAIVSYERALEIDPHHALALYNLGVIYLEREAFDRAVPLLEKASDLNPEDAATLTAMGTAYLGRQEYKRAETFFKDSLELRPKDPEATAKLAVVYNRTRRWEQVVRLIGNMFFKNPQYTMLLFQKVDALIDLNRQDDALADAQKAVDMHPGNEIFLNYLGNVYRRLNRFDEGIDVFEKLTEKFPDQDSYWSNLSLVYKADHQLDRAIETGERAYKLNPYSFAIALNLGTAYRDANKLEQAIYYSERALELMPESANAHYNLGVYKLADEDYAYGWGHHEWRWLTSMTMRSARPTHKPEWHGQDLNDRVLLVYADQGVGDTIQFCRYVPLLKKQYPNVTILFECEDKLVSLMQSVLGDDVKICPRSQEKIEVLSFDYHMAVMSLPAELGLGFDNSHTEFPYIQSINPKTYKDADHGFVVGLAWRSINPELGYKRSLDIEELTFLKDFPGVKFINLQYGDVDDELENAKKSGLNIYQDETADQWERIEDLVDQIAGCDLILSIDNTTVHIAGAMNKPVWTMLPYSAYWRWLVGHSNTPWYPSMRLFRQRDPGHFSSVLDEVKRELETYFADTKKSALTPKPFKSKKENQSKAKTLVLGGGYQFAPFEERVAEYVLQSDAFKAEDTDYEFVSARQIELTGVSDPTLQDFDTDMYFSEWFYRNPSLMYDLKNCDRVLINPQKPLVGGEIVTVRLLYLAYVAHNRFNKEVTFLPHAAFPEGGMQLSDPQIVAYFRKAYLPAKNVYVNNPHTKNVLEKIEIASTLKQWNAQISASNDGDKQALVSLARQSSLSIVRNGGNLISALKNTGRDVKLVLPKGDQVIPAVQQFIELLRADQAIKYDVVRVSTMEEWQQAFSRSEIVFGDTPQTIVAAYQAGKKVVPIISDTTPEMNGVCSILNLPSALSLQQSGLDMAVERYLAEQSVQKLPTEICLSLGDV